jgi:hypothetical protein
MSTRWRHERVGAIDELARVTATNLHYEFATVIGTATARSL